MKRRQASAAEAANTEVVTGEPAPVTGWRPAPLGRRGWLVLAAIVLLVNLPVLHLLVRRPPATSGRVPVSDDFSDPGTVARNYRSLGGYPRVINGELLSPGTKNNPLWLDAALPRDVVVEVSARPINPDGEIRVTLFGNGIDADTGYQAILGSWSPMGSPGRVGSSLVRLDENGATLSRWLSRARVPGDLRSAGFGKDSGLRIEAPPTTPDPAHVYRMRFERRGSVLRWSVDGRLMAELNDPFPLTGPGHDRLGLSSGEWDVYYDDLRVTPAGGGGFATLAAAPSEPAPGPFSDDFSRTQLGPDWLATDPAAVSIENGALVVQRAHNHPVWLRKPIPDDVVIDLDVWTDSPEGDMKVEVFGDGQSFHRGDPRAAYDATGYVLVMGGWRNTLSAIARQHEHAADRVTRAEPPVVPGRKYHWTIRRQGRVLTWLVDGQPFLTFDDPDPLRGAGHRSFGFSGWESKVYFDNLKIRPL
ncbi:MAG: hypothetical protein ACXWLL_04995 [Myxococcaceae bacterium]